MDNQAFVKSQNTFDVKKVISRNLDALRIARGLRTVKELAEEVGVPYESFNKYANGQAEPKAAFFVVMHQFGINLDWLIAGEGEMYRANRPDQRHRMTIYEGNGIAVHSNHGSIGVGELRNDFGGRGGRLCQFATWWMESHSPDEQAWLETQVKRAVPEYVEWLKEQGK